MVAGVIVIKFDPNRCKIKPFAHQVEDTQTVVDNLYFGIFSEMGTGKSAIGVNAACTLFDAGKIDSVVIIAPASVRCVWTDETLGEVKKHSWIPASAYDFHQKVKRVWGDGKLSFVVSNYEFIRNPKRLEELCTAIKGQRVLLILDEVTYCKNRMAAQTKATLKLRKACARCIIFTGTPITNSPLDLWSMMNILSPDILEKRFKNWYAFRAEFCEMKTLYLGARRIPQVSGYKNLDKLAKIVAPYVLRRLKSDCLDLPEKLYTEREVALTPESWKRYCELKKDALITLAKDNVRIEPNAAVRLMRLAQLTSGILGRSASELIPGNNPLPLQEEDLATENISDEKLRWCVKYLTEECTAKAVIVWARWRRERERLFDALPLVGCTAGPMMTSQLYGGQNKKERESAVEMFSNLNNPVWKKLGRAVLIAQQHAGSHGLNLIAATEHIFLSNDFSLGIRLQAEDRSHRPGQKNAVTYIDVLAVGPKGQKTIDHTIFRALRDKKNVADLTTAEWRKELEDEEG